MNSSRGGQSPGGRFFKELFGLMGLGFALFALGIVVLFWVEGGILSEHNALREMKEQVRLVPAASPASVNDNSVIHTSGRLEAGNTLGDGLFIEPGTYLKLARLVETYQWVESKQTQRSKETGGIVPDSGVYNYYLRWSSRFHDSDQFKVKEGHTNTQSVYQSKEFHVNQSSLGGFEGSSILAQLSPSAPLPLERSMVVRPQSRDISESGYLLPQKMTPAYPQVGDIRVSFKALPAGELYSVMAVQKSTNQLVDFVAKDGRKKLIVKAGRMTPAEMIASEKAKAAAVAWPIRIFGAFLIFIGFTVILEPYRKGLAFIPFLRSGDAFSFYTYSVGVSVVMALATMVVAMSAHSALALFIVGTFFLGGVEYLVIHLQSQEASESEVGGVEGQQSLKTPDILPHKAESGPADDGHRGSKSAA